MAEHEYTVLSPIKVVGEEIPKDQRPAPLKGQRQRTHERKVVESGTITLSEEDAAPLLEARAIRLAGPSGDATHDPEVVGFEGEAVRKSARKATSQPAELEENKTPEEDQPTPAQSAQVSKPRRARAASSEEESSG